MDGVAFSFNGQVDLAAVIALLALALTVIQWGVSLASGSRAAARSQAMAICARAIEMTRIDIVNYTPEFGLEVMNGSNDLIYQVVLTAVLVQGAGPHNDREVEGYEHRVVLSCVAPGKTARRVGRLDCSMGRVPGCEVAFTDRYGRSWLRSSDGRLRRLWFTTPVEHYGLTQPVGWMDFNE